jgi:hypothetical protein
MELTAFNVQKVYNDYCNFKVSDVLKNPNEKDIYVSSLKKGKKELLGMLKHDDDQPDELKYKYLRLGVYETTDPADIRAKRMLNEIEEKLYILEGRSKNKKRIPPIVFDHSRPEEFSKKLCEELKKSGLIQESWEQCEPHFKKSLIWEEPIFWMEGPKSLFYLFHRLKQKEVITPTDFKNLLELLCNHFDYGYRGAKEREQGKYDSFKTTHNQLIESKLEGEKNTQIDNILEKLKKII